MASLQTFAAAALVLVAGGGLARRSTFRPRPLFPPAETSSNAFSGWYLRGDLGVGIETAPILDPASGAIDAGFPLPRLSPFAVFSFASTTLTPSGTIDGGVGYVLNPWLRMDATLEYRFGVELRSTYAIDDPAPPGAAGPFRSADRLRGSVSSLVGLINFYVDLGNFWGATPFVGVGAGVGVADNALSGVSDQGFAIAGSCATVPVGGFFSNASRTSFAWALTAGFDVDLAPNLKLEASYRYLYLGSIAVGGRHCVPGAQACLGGAGVAASSRNALASNDVGVGLIWLIGEQQPAPRPIIAHD
jgi:opacity protein-like surface antigen